MDTDHLFLDEVFLSLQGEGLEVGRPHLFLRLGGCPLRCSYCDTPRSWKRQSRFELHLAHSTQSRPNPVDRSGLEACLEEVLHSHGQDQDQIMLAVTGGEPLEQAAFLASWLPQWQGPVLLETAGIDPSALSTLVSAVDLLSLDWKFPHTLRSGQEHLETLACVDVARDAGCRTQIKLVLTADTNRAQVADALHSLAQHLPHAVVFLQPVTPFGQGPDAPPGDRLLAWSLEFRDLPLDLRVLPQMHTLLGVR